MRIGLLACASLVLTALIPMGASAQGSGELWEITMNMPGLPAGMMKPNRVCQGDDPERAAKEDPNKRDCKVTDSKKTATRTTVTLSCKDGSTMVIDQQYNAGRTEFKSTMSTKGGKQGDFTMNMTGRRVGTCDAVAERKKQDAKVDEMKKQGAAMAAAGAAAMKDADEKAVKECNAALEKMDRGGFGTFGLCYNKKNDKTCSHYAEMNKQYPQAAKVCNANIGEFCKRFQTAEGFMRVRGREETAKWCGVTVASIKASQCPRVAKSQTPLSFLGAYCPVEAKPIAAEHCTGRDYTSRSGGKYNAFCTNYLANADFQRNADFERNSGEDTGSDSSSRSSASGGAPSTPGSAPAQSQGQKSADAVKEGVSQGINKLRGLFGK
jgi:hypothetical protein